MSVLEDRPGRRAHAGLATDCRRGGGGLATVARVEPGRRVERDRYTRDIPGRRVEGLLTVKFAV